MRNESGYGAAEWDDVNTKSSQPIDAERAERLLSGVAAPDDRLARLLVAAAAPAQPGELAGEEAAMMAFRATVRPVATPAAAVRPRPRRVLQLISVPVAALAAVVVAGVAVAAGTGVIGNPLDVGGPTTSRVEPTGSTVTTTPSSGGWSAPAPGAGATQASPTATPSAAHSAEPGPNPAASPDPSMHGLCVAYQHIPDRERALQTPAFAALVVAAGGVDLVDAYCQTLIGDADTG